MRFKKSLDKFKGALNLITSHQIDLSKRTTSFKTLVDFKESKLAYYIKLYKASFKELLKDSLELDDLIKYNPSNKEILESINRSLKQMTEHYKKGNTERIADSLAKIYDDYSRLAMPIDKERPSLKLNILPDDIRAEVKADIGEIERCFSNDCLRSSIVLCGRVLEVALHRKYYEVTGNDLLEKSPGIGLGNLIAKLKDKKVAIDPGLTQQIHLINQVRISSVHKKQEPFNPTKSQAHAIILYTLDVLDKLFKP